MTSMRIIVIRRKNVRRDAVRVRKFVLSTRGLGTRSLKKYNTLKSGVRDVSKLKEVVIANIACIHLT
jgi:hypothetical protein